MRSNGRFMFNQFVNDIDSSLVELDQRVIMEIFGHYRVIMEIFGHYRANNDTCAGTNERYYLSIRRPSPAYLRAIKKAEL